MLKAPSCGPLFAPALVSLMPRNSPPMRRLLTFFFAFTLMATAQNTTPAPSPAPDLNELNRMIARFAPAPLKVDLSGLSAGDKKALAKLVEAARLTNDVFLDQLWSGNTALYRKLKQDKSPVGQARLHYFWINKAPWSEIDEHKAFLPGVPARKPLGANFYPEDMTKEEFESWVKTLYPESKAAAEGFFTVIRRGPDKKLRLIPYGPHPYPPLAKQARLLKEAADLTDNASLKKFLTTRAEAFLNNNYFESDRSEEHT